MSSYISQYFFPLSHTIFIFSNEHEKYVRISPNLRGVQIKVGSLVSVYAISIMSREPLFFEVEYLYYPVLHMAQNYYSCPEIEGLGQICCMYDLTTVNYEDLSTGGVPYTHRNNYIAPL
jgi:hypothetical protein